MSLEGNCESCIFFKYVPRHDETHKKFVPLKTGEIESGRCRRFPPQGSVASAVLATDVCGEYKTDDEKVTRLAARQRQRERAEFAKTDCCRRFSAGENHATGCKNHPDYVPEATEEGQHSGGY